MFTTIELFAGAGGLALGIEKAGFKTLALNEFNADACATLRKNRPNWNVIEGDVAEISGLDLEEYFSVRKGELDLLSGGAPCQAFSYAGKKLGLEDARGTLFYHYATFLGKLQPKMFLFENVWCNCLSYRSFSPLTPVQTSRYSCRYSSFQLQKIPQSFLLFFIASSASPFVRIIGKCFCNLFFIGNPLLFFVFNSTFLSMSYG